MSERARERLFWGLVALELAAFMAWQGAHLGGFQWGSDEGIYLMRVRLRQQGHALYRDIWTDQLPGLIELLRLTFALVGSSVEAGRALIALLSTGGLLGVALLAYAQRARVGALAAIPMLALAPNVFWLSRAIVSPDLPSISLGALALGLMAVYQRRRKVGWLAASGLCFALALYIKATAVLALAPAGLWLLADLWRRRAERSLPWRPLALWLGCLVAPLVIGLLLHSPRQMWAQFVGTQIASSQMELKIGPHAAKIAAYLAENNWGLMALALAGALVGWRRSRGAIVVALGWLGVSLLVLLIRSPMWPSHHLVVLLPPLAWLAALGVSTLWAACKERALTGQRAIAGLGVLLYAASLPGIITADRALLLPKPALSSEAAIAFLQERYPQGAVVISDYHMISYRAGCTVPPQLATVTKKRLQLGLLTAEDLIRATQEAQADAVLFWDEQLDRAPEYVSWVKRHYLLAFKWGYHSIYVLPEADAISHRQEALLGGVVRLVGYDAPRLAVDPGEELEITLYWQAVAPIEARLSSFVHLVDAEGRQIGYSDHLAWGEEYPSTLWQVGETVADRHRVRVPAGAAPGQHYLSVGLHDQDVAARLDVVDGEGRPIGGGQVTLAANPVVRWEPQFEAPDDSAPLQVRAGEVADLIGWGHRLAADGQTVEVELVWRARTPPAWPSFAVFAHLHQGDVLLAQHDAIPDQGARPTIAWRQGEIIRDRHPISLAEVDWAQPLHLAVGLYDPADGRRVPLFAPDGRPLADDRAELDLILPLREGG